MVFLKKGTPNKTHERRRLAEIKMEYLINFIERPNLRRDTLTLNGVEYFLTKMEDGSTRISEKP